MKTSKRASDQSRNETAPGRLRPISRRNATRAARSLSNRARRSGCREDRSRREAGDIARRSREAKSKQLRERLLELQQALYAEHSRSLLIVIQAMDTGGKDGAIKKICSGLDPNGVQLTNFKFPSPDEWDHDFLWRVHHAAPRKGMIGIWNRSHYEDVLVPRVHRQISESVWRERCEDINAFERLLTRNGVPC